MGTRVRLAAVVLLIAGLLATAVLAAPVLMVMGSMGGDADEPGSSTACAPVATAGGRRMNLDADQLANARAVIQTGRGLDVPARGLVVAVATALQESTLRNLDWGDRDSVGLFQQRDAWGSHDERTDPPTAARMFYTGGRAGQPGLLDISGWSRMTVTAAAQAVQRSAFPLAYAKWEVLAGSLVRSVVGDEPLNCADDAIAVGLPSGAVGTMLTVALQQQGDPYIWGATGPDAFDCSGLIVYSWREAGYRVKVRTAAQMWSVSTPVAAGSEQPGDLLFGEFGARGPGPGHVMIVVRKGVAVQAPSAGRNVEVTNYRATGGWRLGRLKPSALAPLPSAA